MNKNDIIALGASNFYEVGIGGWIGLGLFQSTSFLLIKIMVNSKFIIQLTKPKEDSIKTWIRVSKDTGFIYVNVGHHGRFYANLSQNVIRVTKNTVGSYKVTYKGPWETEQGKFIGAAITKTYHFTVSVRDKAAFEQVFNLN